MCRITGILDFASLPIESTVIKMRDAMRRGGPDDCGIYMDDEWPLALGQRRLALIDLSPLGHQPMLDNSGKIVLVFNGEIYNFQAIKAELEQKNYQFKSHSDTEVIIYAYQEWGTACFKKFNGMFALALLDKRKHTLILARDHAGIKPLYYSLQNNRLIFASEVRAFKALEPNWPENEDWKKYFLLFGHLPEPVTTLQNVQPLKKGTFIEIDLPTLAIKKEQFFSIYYNYTINNAEEAIEKVHTTLTNAVERHLISDAPIGLFLSGGLDSSLLTVIAKKFIPENLHTLSIVFDNEKYSEKYYQDLIIQQTGAKNQSFIVTENDFMESMPDILEAMDQPSNDGINSYFISKYARKYGLTAVLSGLGADELFGGYSSFFRTNSINSIKWLPEFMFSAAGVFPDDKRKKLAFLGMKNGLGEYLFNRGFFIPAQVAQLLGCTELEVNNLLQKMQENMPAFVEKLLPQEKISYLESNLYMQNQLLKDTDYMSMWHGLEVRVPFLDKELIELVYSINPDIRYNKQQAKYLLVEAFNKELPSAIWKRPKQGFVFPFEQWMKQVKPNNSNEQMKIMNANLASGKLHWSRYWSYVLSQQNNIKDSITS
jgi:asparagine synthase (glutamine-hydrolysing)